MSPITLPDHSPVSAAALRAIAERHGLTDIDAAIDAEPVPLTQTGMINTVYALGRDYVLRVPRNHPGHVAQLLRERAAVPAARAAGVRTPALIAFDDSGEILPVPYAIYERVAGTPFELLGHDVRVAPPSGERWAATWGGCTPRPGTAVPAICPRGGGCRTRAPSWGGALARAVFPPWRQTGCCAGSSASPPPRSN